MSTVLSFILLLSQKTTTLSIVPKSMVDIFSIVTSSLVQNGVLFKILNLGCGIAPLTLKIVVSSETQPYALAT